MAARNMQMAMVVLLGKLRHEHAPQCNQDSMGPLRAAELGQGQVW